MRADSIVALISFTLIFIICSTSLVSGSGIPCHYCGIKGLCPLPYDAEDEDNQYITCPNSCMKFDGYNDNGRIIVRECSEKNLNQCDEDQEYFGAKGTLCICNGENCNPGNIPTLSVTLVGIVTMFIFKLLLA